MNTPLVLLAVAVFVLLVLARTIRIAPQTRAGAIERFGRHERGALRG
jgi:regulator of protease activity HflC (stomatin/prohibitin superfamily)